MIKKPQTSGLAQQMLKKKNATRNVQLSLPIETRIFEHPMHIYMYFDDIFQESSKQSRLTQSEPS